MSQGHSARYLIFGAGALGSVFGCFLQDAGCSVAYAGRGEHFSAVLKKGLKVTGIWGNHFIPPEAIEPAFGQEGDEFSTILLCVKSKDTDSAALQAAPLLREDGIMVSIQNGLGNWETIARHVGEHRTVGARVIFGAEIPEPGTARVTVNADDVLLGEPFSPVNHVLFGELRDDLLRSKIPTRAVNRDEIWAAIWGKVLYNCALNPLGAMLEVPYGKLGENEESRVIIREVIREIFLVMSAKGVKVPYRDWESYYDYLMTKQLPPTVGHRASMLQDILMGRKTEIEALNGSICCYARELGIQTPYNDLLTSLIKFKEKPQNQIQARQERPAPTSASPCSG